jgi:hypothetical protein
MIGIRQIPSLFRMTTITGESIGLPAWGLSHHPALTRRAGSEPHAASDPCACALALAGHGSAYNEEAFQYLLTVERKRFEHSSRPFVLMLVELEEHSGQTTRFEPELGARLFASLGRSLRDTDVIGWYRDGRIAGAVLTHLGDVSIADVSRQLAERITRTLRDDLPEAIAHRLKMRLYQPLASMQP